MRTTAALSALVWALGVSAAAVDKRIPLVTQFGGYLSTTNTCNTTPDAIEEFAVGSACGICTNFPNTARMASLKVVTLVPECQLTIFTTFDCSDPGIVSGLGCWSPEGGAAAFKVTCPWWTGGPTTPACNA